MHATLSLLAAFLAVVVVGVCLTALHDALERAWLASDLRTPRRQRVVAGGHRVGASVAWRHLH